MQDILKNFQSPIDFQFSDYATLDNFPSLFKSILDNPNLNKRKRKKLLRDSFLELMEYLDRPAKNINVKRSVSGVDILNALIRMPEVQESLKKIDKESNKTKKRKLESEFLDLYGFGYGIILKLAKHPELFCKYEYYFDEDTIHIFPNFEKCDLGLLKYRDGKHIIIAVNLSKKKKDIIRKFEEIIKLMYRKYHDRIQKEATRDRETNIDYWKVYDLRANGLKWTSVTATIFGTYTRSKKTEAIRYYNKAKRIIERVRTDIANTKGNR